MINLYKTSRYGFALALLLLVGPLSAHDCPPLELAQQEDQADVRHDKGLLWQINGPGLDPSYLFGTIHVSDAAIVELPAPVGRALRQSQRFVMEARLDGPAALTFAQDMFFRDGTRLSDLLAPDLYARAEELLAGYGMPPLAVQSLKPWAAFMTLNMPPDEGLPLDLVLMGEAQKQGLPVDGLETVAEQAAVFENLSRSMQVELLRDSICHYKALQRDMADMKQLYLQRDLAGLYSYHNKYHLQNRAGYRKLMKHLLWDRNRRMADRMQPLLKKGNVFVAIGAMHLPGEQGILSLLENAGYTVKAVY